MDTIYVLSIKSIIGLEHVIYTALHAVHSISELHSIVIYKYFHLLETFDNLFYFLQIF